MVGAMTLMGNRDDASHHRAARVVCARVSPMSMDNLGNNRLWLSPGCDDMLPMGHLGGCSGGIEDRAGSVGVMARGAAV